MQRIKTTQIAETRTGFLQQQGYRCAICGEDCQDDPVLDHNHKTGAIRAALHRSCNMFLGKLENNATRNGVQLHELPDWLRAAASYLDAHSTAQTDLLHPTYRTPDELAARRKKRRAETTKARKIAKAQLDAQTKP